MTEALTKAGTTAPDDGTLGHRVIELNGANAGNANGIDALSTIRGLAINRFQRDGIWLTTKATGSTIVGNDIGTDVTGFHAECCGDWAGV